MERILVGEEQSIVIWTMIALVAFKEIRERRLRHSKGIKEKDRDETRLDLIE